MGKTASAGTMAHVRCGTIHNVKSKKKRSFINWYQGHLQVKKGILLRLCQSFYDNKTSGVKYISPDFPKRETNGNKAEAELVKSVRL